ncbi:MAG TPA: YhjD/YihY/BrkB family envelope integrity protein [Blastocatellia bacterium]|nr:YhjD/YihY/BrkB family envelope integrity protein [Blastocatellia bacterium]
MKVRSILELFKAAFSDLQKDKASRLAAATAYYAIISLAPLLIIVIAMVALVFGQEAAQGHIAGQIQHLVGERGAQAIQEIIVHASRPSTGVIASVIAIATLLFGASGVFDEL